MGIPSDSAFLGGFAFHTKNFRDKIRKQKESSNFVGYPVEQVVVSQVLAGPAAETRVNNETLGKRFSKSLFIDQKWKIFSR